jgi:hypothetical protein
MTFWNKGVKPYPYNGIKIQDFGNTPTDENIAKHHGVNGSERYVENKDAILCFACDYDTDAEVSQRVVTFKAFLDNFKINYEIGRDERQSLTSPYIVSYLGKFAFSYSISFDVPAHSVNEAISNMARFSELERILTYPHLGSTNDADANGYRFPLSYILFNNLINNGGFWERYGSNTPFDYTFANIRKYGLRGVVKNINMTPDLELGVFEYNGQTYFKSFKISFDIAVPNTPFQVNKSIEESSLVYQNQSIMPLQLMGDATDKAYNFSTSKYLDALGETEQATGAPETTTGKNVDTMGFPFNIPVSLWGKGFDYRTLNNYVNGATTQYSQNKNIFFSICPNDGSLNGDVAQNTNVLKFICYLESFSYAKEQHVKDFESSEAGITIPIFGSSAKINFDFTLNIVADNVNDALRNAAKLSYLFRMIILGGDIKNKILLSNLIKSPSSSGRRNSYSLSDTYGNGLVVNVQSVSFDIDLEMGFFEYNSFFIPKSFSLAFSTQVVGSDMGKIITNNDLETNKKLYADGDSIKWPFGINYDNPEENE